MTNKKTSTGSKVVKVAAVGAALAGIAAGAYFFLGPNGKKNQKHAKAWVIKMKGDVVDKLEKAKEVSEEAYHTIIDTVAAQYAKKMKTGQADVAELAADLKKHWKALSKSVKGKK
jgi:hypothetical protein